MIQNTNLMRNGFISTSYKKVLYFPCMTPRNEGPRPTMGDGMSKMLHEGLGRLKDLAQKPEARIGAGLFIVGLALYAKRDELRPQLNKIKEDLNLKDAKVVAAEAIDAVKEKLVKETKGVWNFAVKAAEKIGGSSLDAFIGQFATHADEWEERLKDLKGEDLTKAMKDIVNGFMHPEASTASKQPGRRPAQRVTIVDADNNPLTR